MNAPELLRTARSRRGWTQAQLAARCGVPQSVIARWESGRVSPRIDSLNRILAAAGFEPTVVLVDDCSVDRDQLAERLRWTPLERLRYLADMIAFEERARSAKKEPLSDQT